MKLAKDLRLELKFEPAEAAREAGMSISQWMALEEQTENPRLDTIKKLRKLARKAGWSLTKYSKELGLD